MSEKKQEPTTMNSLMAEIREITKKQKAASRVDEIRVMKTMLNDPDFTVSIYDHNKGLIGQRSPREEAVKFISTVTSNMTGLDTKTAMDLGNKYEFTKKDAMFMLDMSKDFTTTYLSTGRKLPVVQGPDSEASLFYRSIPTRTKAVPSLVQSGVVNPTTVPAYNKVICRSKCPKYNTTEQNNAL